MRPEYDCVVVGAGLVGAAQALAMRRVGLKVLSIDARAPLAGAPGSDVRGLALAPSSRNILSDLDVWPALEPHVTPIATVQVSDQGRFGGVVLRATDVGLDALGYVCPADELLHALERALTDAVDVRWETTVEDVDVLEHGVRITLCDAAGVATLGAKLVVAADGAQSLLRARFGIGTTEREYDQHAVVANLNVAAIDRTCAFERFTPNGPLALLPTRAGRHVAVRCCRTKELERLLALDDAAYLEELREGFGGRFGEFSALGRRTHHPLRLARADRITDKRIALVGAAANCIHPNGAQGLNLGLRDIAALAAVIGDASRDPGHPERLAEYARARSSDHRAVARLTDMLAQVFATRLPFVPMLRNLAMLAIDVTPTAKRRMIRRACGLLGETPLAGWVSTA